jgi:hypothetical protein
VSSRCYTVATFSRIIDHDESRFGWWAQQDLNLRPLACKASALPLSYAPDAARKAREATVSGR